MTELKCCSHSKLLHLLQRLYLAFITEDGIALLKFVECTKIDEFIIPNDIKFVEVTESEFRTMMGIVNSTLICAYPELSADELCVDYHNNEIGEKMCINCNPFEATVEHETSDNSLGDIKEDEMTAEFYHWHIE